MTSDTTIPAPTLLRSNSKIKSAESKEVERIHLRYLDCRGRLEPALILLEDAGAAYSLELIPVATWRAMQENNRAGPSQGFPFHYLPTLEQGIAHDGRSNIIAETSAILRYLSSTLRAPDSSPWSVPIATARHDMILEASLAFSTTLLNAPLSQDWLTDAELQKLWTDSVKPYLVALEFHLQEDLMPPLLAPALPPSDARPGTQLTATSAASAYAIELIEAIYGRERIKRTYPYCEQLRDNVYERPKVKEWLIRTQQLSRPWVALSPFGTAEQITAAAKRIQKEELVIQ